MNRLHRAIPLLLMCVLLCASPARAATRTIASTDHIPLGDWTYDAMTKLAADGRVPGYAARVFEGDRLFDRMQMAYVVASVVDKAEASIITPAQAALIDKLVLEFRPELAALGTDALDEWEAIARRVPPETENPLLLGYVRGTAVESPETDSSLIVPYRASAYSDLSGHAFAMVTLADKEERFFQQFADGPALDKVILQGYDENLVWSFGRQYLNWGPAYSGSLILSDNSPGFWQGRIAADVDFGKLFGRFKITEFASVFKDDTTLYFFGRRWEKPISPRWHWGISETALLNEAPNPSILVLPFYVYQRMWGGPGSETDESMNTLYATDLTYRARGGQEYYGELLIDDITAPRLFGDDYDRPRKIGYTLGVYLPGVFKDDARSSLRAEYISIDRQTYEATRPEVPELAYVHDGEIIGHPIGPNAKALYLRAEHYLSDEWSIIGEYFDRRQKDSGAPERSGLRVISLTAAYDVTPDKSIALRIAPFRVSPPSEESRSGVGYELRASYAF